MPQLFVGRKHVFSSKDSFLKGYFCVKKFSAHPNTLVYRKPTNTNLILNFNALCPTKWKSGLIPCFLNRAKRMCSSDIKVSKLK